MRTTENSNYRLFSGAGINNKSSVFSKNFNFNIIENQSFVVPWQLTEKETTQKVEEQVFNYSHF